MSSNLPNITAAPSPQGCDVSVNTKVAVTRLRVSKRCLFPPENFKREPAHDNTTTKEVVPREEKGRTKPCVGCGKERCGAERNVRSHL